jgi:hypothetical protein
VRVSEPQVQQRGVIAQVTAGVVEQVVPRQQGGGCPQQTICAPSTLARYTGWPWASSMS